MQPYKYQSVHRPRFYSNIVLLVSKNKTVTREMMQSVLSYIILSTYNGVSVFYLQPKCIVINVHKYDHVKMNHEQRQMLPRYLGQEVGMYI